jgi:hypothetical protein
MTQHVVGFFCGTGYTTATDNSFNDIKNNLTADSLLLGYDGCQVHGGGTFSYGVEKQANQFIKDLKANLANSNENIQINLIAHSRGTLSALLAIKKIQKDPLLKNRVQITADFRDPVPGNFQLTTKFAGDLASANQVLDLRDCDILKKAYITLQERPIISIAFDALIPKFHQGTHVEIETLPGYHDVQQRKGYSPRFDHEYLFPLGLIKTLLILKEDKVPLAFPEYPDEKELENEFKRIQLESYEKILQWAKTREIPFAERDLHFGGKIRANNYARLEFDGNSAVNWHHAQLKGITPNHILYGETQPHYNYRKTPLEHYCDLTLTLDRYVNKHPEKKDLINNLKKSSSQFLEGKIKLDEYKDAYENALKEKFVHNKKLIKAYKYLCMDNYFQSLDQIISNKVPPNNPLHENLKNLRAILARERSAEIEFGIPDHQSNALRVAANTREFIEDIYLGGKTKEEIIQAANDYAKHNIRIGRNWNTGTKIIVSGLIAVAAAVVGCVIGAFIGLGIGFACGAVTGPGALATAVVGAFIGGFKGAMVASILAHRFFSLSESEKQIKALANKVKSNVETSDEEVHDVSLGNPKTAL